MCADEGVLYSQLLKVNFDPDQYPNYTHYPHLQKLMIRATARIK